MSEWQEVPGNPGNPFYKFKAVGDSIAGKVVGKRQIPGLEGKIQDVVDLATKDGDFTVACTADLKTKFAKIDLGKLVSIKHTGTKKIAGKPSPMKVFEVKVAAVG